jgi:DNA-directed RNA polymerase specialized sigma24 family protein
MIRFANIDYHRKRRKMEERNQLVFDSPVGEEGELTLGEYVMSRLPESPMVLPTSNPDYFEANLNDPELYSVFSKLTDRQKIVVTLSYSACELDTEIARMLNVSQQAITKTRISALNKMRRGIQAKPYISRSRMGVS